MCTFWLKTWGFVLDLLKLFDGETNKRFITWPLAQITQRASVWKENQSMTWKIFISWELNGFLAQNEVITTRRTSSVRKASAFPARDVLRNCWHLTPVSLSLTSYLLITNISISKYKYIPSKLLKLWVDIQIHKQFPLMKMLTSNPIITSINFLLIRSAPFSNQQSKNQSSKNQSSN